MCIKINQGIASRSARTLHSRSCQQLAPSCPCVHAHGHSAYTMHERGVPGMLMMLGGSNRLGPGLPAVADAVDTEPEVEQPATAALLFCAAAVCAAKGAMTCSHAPTALRQRCTHSKLQV